jgi:hypothetical protein
MIATETAGVWAKAEGVELPANAAAEGRLGQISSLTSIACDPAGTCTAGGVYFLESPREQVAMTVTKTGGKWKATELPAPEHGAVEPDDVLSSISCPASGACEAAGGYRTASAGLQAMVTVGEAGGVFATPTELSVPLGAVEFASGGLPLISCPASGSCLTIDPYKTEGGQDESYVATSSGGVWGAATELPETGQLLGGACPQTGACAAVGFSGLAALATSGVGTSWSASSAITLPTGADTSTESRLTSVACPAEGSCVAVGDYATGSRLRQGMVAYASGTDVQKTPVTEPEPTPATKTEPMAKTEPAKPTPSCTVGLAGTHLTVKASGASSVKLTDTGTATCAGKLTLTVAMTTGKGKKKHTHTETIGIASFSVAANGTTTIELTLNTAGRDLLRSAHGKLGATLEIVKSSPAPAATQRNDVELTAAKAKAKKG